MSSAASVSAQRQQMVHDRRKQYKRYADFHVEQDTYIRTHHLQDEVTFKCIFSLVVLSATVSR
mgnify:CR=1 FL=1